MSRKYRQRGYQDQSGSEPRKRRAQSPKSSADGPRSPRMTGFQKVTRCSFCGVTLRTELDQITASSKCSGCGADLRCCKNCVHFDPAGRFECTEPITERVQPKDRGNSCDYFEIKSTVEKQVSSQDQSSPDPRQAFEDLFK